MVRKDFILRMIEQLVGVIHELLGLRAAEDFQAALELLERTYPQLTGLDGDLLRNTEPATLLQLLSFAGELDLGKVVAAAELLKEEGDIRASLDDDAQAYACYDRSLFLFVTLVERHGPQLIDSRLQRVDAVADAIARYALPAATGYRLFDYYRLTHRYADAENWLFRVLEAEPHDNDLRQAGVAFFADLLQRTDHELYLGGLSRTEAADSLAELTQNS
ncbi:MAG: hypothetical protein H7Z42_13110 [Roseiflexaceae bacterium]|nr:hypothetical protein [Roseiflexaceae bacterium]